MTVSSIATTTARLSLAAATERNFDKTGSPVESGPRPTVSVTLSREAQGLGEVPPSATPAQSARAKLDADYAKARADGTWIVSDTAYGGRHLNVSGLTDEELAAVKTDADGLFKKNEEQTAWAELGARVRVTLAPFALGAGQDPRAYQSAVQTAYRAMSPAVREALGWDQSMLDASERLVESAEQELGEFDRKSLLQKFIDHLKALRAAGRERPLDLDVDQLVVDDPIISPSRSGGESGPAPSQVLNRLI